MAAQAELVDCRKRRDLRLQCGVEASGVRDVRRGTHLYTQFALSFINLRKVGK
jgi:hypothetical protein